MSVSNKRERDGWNEMDWTGLTESIKKPKTKRSRVISSIFQIGEEISPCSKRALAPRFSLIEFHTADFSGFCVTYRTSAMWTPNPSSARSKKVSLVHISTVTKVSYFYIYWWKFALPQFTDRILCYYLKLLNR